jgi:hypothetical protein
MENMEIIFSIFSDLMFWSSIPILIVTGIWEARLALSATGHMLAQIAIVLVVLGWVRFWFFTGEYCRLRNRPTIREHSQHKLPTDVNSNPPVEKNLVEETCFGDPEAVDARNEINQRKYAANH